MLILHLLNHVDRVGNGIVNVAVDLACLQARAGHDVWVASKGGAFESLLAKHGVRHVRLDQSRRPMIIWRALRDLRALIRRERIEVVHAHMVTGYVLARLLRPGASWRLVATVHNEWQRSSTLMRGADRIITLSEGGVDRLAARGLPRPRLRVVRNGVIGSPRDEGAAAPVLALRQPAIVTVAGMYERKGIADLIVAFDALGAPHSNAQLYIVGEGPDRPRFEALARQLPSAERIHFEGFQPAPRAYLRDAALFVLASHTEPFGLVLAEARDCGCAIVATAVDGAPEALDRGRAGLLVPPHNPPALTAAMARLLEDPAEQGRWRDAARENVDWLRVERQHRETLAVYQDAFAR